MWLIRMCSELSWPIGRCNAWGWPNILEEYHGKLPFSSATDESSDLRSPFASLLLLGLVSFALVELLMSFAASGHFIQKSWSFHEHINDNYKRFYFLKSLIWGNYLRILRIVYYSFSGSYRLLEKRRFLSGGLHVDECLPFFCCKSEKD